MKWKSRSLLYRPKLTRFTGSRRCRSCRTTSIRYVSMTVTLRAGTTTLISLTGFRRNGGSTATSISLKRVSRKFGRILKEASLSKQLIGLFTSSSLSRKILRSRILWVTKSINWANRSMLHKTFPSIHTEALSQMTLKCLLRKKMLSYAMKYSFQKSRRS